MSVKGMIRFGMRKTPFGYTPIFLGTFCMILGTQNSWILMNYMAHNWTADNKKPAIFSEFLYFFELRWMMAWWRRRESNPRPEILHLKFYMRSLSFVFHPARLPQAGFLRG